MIAEKKETLENLLSIAVKKYGEKAKEKSLSDWIIEAYEKDLEETKANIKNKSMFTSNLIKSEIINRCSDGTKAKFKLNKQATLILCRYAYIVEKGDILFSITPLDRETFLITCKVDTEKMNNAQITYYNISLNLNIPLNEEIEQESGNIDEYDISENKKEYIKITK